ncbi:hypothetical protein B9J09_04560 [Xylella fastidiosa subsp. pauca]|nr:hypothetical protein [Xylella fastidiosa]ARO68403.1 hypothetical protein B9J09_04560 [Xylella fastidiosa subsp. pauca]AVI20537.1 hypothetical protein BCV75_04260 [Xylella fastidiosa]AVI22551.1 hypothetical protein BC375_04305 [Xylella fastidiosa]KIA57771.1 hypothetical protein RA12_08800 [Xylella fastidiosa]KXB10573.1 hypothetical protein ADT33_11190 [Xylella fastidiosa]
MGRIKIDWGRIGLFAVITAVSVVIGCYGQLFVHSNDEARGIIINVFSILAGFLISMITRLGEPGPHQERTWRLYAVKRSNVFARLVRHQWLCIFYLIVLALVFLTAIMARHVPDGRLIASVEKLYLGLMTFTFIYSLLLPGHLISLQMERFDENVESMRQMSASNSESLASASC